MWQTPNTCSPSLVAGPRLTFSFSAGAAFFGAMPDPQASRQEALQHAAKLGDTMHSAGESTCS